MRKIISRAILLLSLLPSAAWAQTWNAACDYASMPSGSFCYKIMQNAWTNITGNISINSSGASTINNGVVANTMMASFASGAILANPTGSSAPPSYSQLTAVMDFGLGSTPAMIAIRGAGGWTAAAMSGDCTTTNALVITCTKVNGVTYPSSFTSGGILYANGTTTVASSAATTNALVKSGGAGAAPIMTGITVDSSNNMSGVGNITFPNSPTLNTLVGNLIINSTASVIMGNSNANSFFLAAGGGNVGMRGLVATHNLSDNGNAARTWGMLRHTTSDTAGNNLTLLAGGATSGATNKAGGDLILQGGTATGNGGSNVKIQVALANQGSGTTDRTAADAFIVDSNFHLRPQGTAPALTSCGGGSPTITGTDVAGTVTMGTTATGCVITFNKAYTSTPHCTVTWQATPLASQSYATATSSITLTQTSTSGNVVNYHCFAQTGG